VRMILALCLCAGGFLAAPPQAVTAAEGIGEEIAVAPAYVSLVVFEEGRPVDGLRVEIGPHSGLTDANGSWQGEVVSGAWQLRVTERGVPLTQLALNLRAGEILQAIITLRGPDRQAFVSLESSHSLEIDDAPDPPDGQPAALAEGSGSLNGQVKSAEDGRSVAGARLFVSGTPVEARTDEDGRYRIELPVGTYSVSVLHNEFATRTIEQVEIKADAQTTRDFDLPPAGLELAEFVVVEPFIEGSLSAVAALRREATAVTDVLSAEQISRTGDSDAGAALKRVTGLTLVDGQFIYVRGLGERYSSVLLNGAVLPSPDPTRRVLPMDLFPTAIISQIVIQKTADSSMPGEFGGGTVQLSTVGYPEEAILTVGVSSGYNSRSAGEDGLTYAGGGRDWTGYDDGTRGVPPLLAEVTADGQFLRQSNVFNPDGVSPEELELIGEELAAASPYRVSETSLPLDRGLSLSVGNSYDLGGDGKIGFLAAVRYSDQWRLRSEQRDSFRFSDSGLQPKDQLTLDITLRNIDLSAFANAGVELGDRFMAGVNLMLLRQSEDETRRSEGEQESQLLRRFRLEWTENELLAGQLFGHYRVPLLESDLVWQYTEGEAQREDPNTREWRRDDDNFDGEFRFSRRADSNSQSWTSVNDRLTNWALDVTQPIPEFGPLVSQFKAGISNISRDRDSSIRSFSFVGTIPFEDGALDQDEVISADRISPNGLRLREGTTPTDNYSASQELTAYYGMLEISLFDRLSLIGGLRVEDNFQEVVSNNLTDPTAPPTVGLIDESDQLWSGSLTWQILTDLQLRLGYSQTLSRPDFREISPSPFIDPLIDLRTVGNPNLKVAAIENWDARLEYYFSEIDSISLAYFYKELSNPIERIASSGGSGTIITLQNALGATVEGWELDFYRGFGFVNEWQWLDRLRLGWLREVGLENYYLAANYADIATEVSIDPTASNSTNTDRALQGASPWVINAQIGYSSPSQRFEWTLAYNEFGERISRAGTLGQPDIFEQPFAQLDFNWKFNFLSHWSLGLSAENILDPEVEFTQGEETTRSFKRGRKFGVSLKYSL